MPWGFEDFDDDSLSPETWQWWRSLFRRSGSLDDVLINIARPKNKREFERRQDDVRPLVEAGLLMLMLDSVTRDLTGTEANRRRKTFRDDLLNVREGNLVTFVQLLQAKGVDGPLVFNGLRQNDFRAKYGWEDHNELHEDLIRYLFQRDLIDDEIETLWRGQFVQRKATDFASTLMWAAETFVLYALGSPLRRLRTMVRASAPRTPLVTRCASSMQAIETRAWSDALLGLTEAFGVQSLLGMDSLTLAMFIWVYLDGVVSSLTTSTPATFDEDMKLYLGGFGVFFGTTFEPVDEPSDRT